MRLAHITASLTRFSSELMYLSVSLSVVPSVLQALVDSGATLNLVHQAVVANLGLKPQPCSPVKVRLANGQPLPICDQQITLDFTIAGIRNSQTFLVAPIGIHSMILGMPWLETTNPSIDWRTKTLTLPSSPDHSCSSTPIPAPRVSTPVRTRITTPALTPTPTPVLTPTPVPTPATPAPKPPSIGLTTRIDRDDIVFLLYLDEVYDLSSVSPNDSVPPIPEIPPEYLELSEAFSKTKAQTLPPHRGHLDHSIPLEDGAKPTFGPIYNLSELELETLKTYIDENLTKGFIRPSSSPFGAPVLFVKKPHGGLRLCVDYRALNRVTIKNRYPLPLISQLLDRLKGKKFFTKLDLRDAFNLIRIALGEEYKTAFRTRYGQFEYLVMPFGLHGAPGTFQSYVNHVLREFIDQFCVVYLDDILIFSDSLEEHIQHVRQILERLLEHGLYVKLEKCLFHARQVSFLGFVISQQGISMEPDRIATIVDWPVPESVHDIQVFLGFANFYRRFIEGYSRVVLPVTQLLRKNTKFNWSPSAQAAFDTIKERFTTGPVLRHFDPTLPSTLHTDASGAAISGIISQPHDGLLHPVAFWSRKMTPAECNYDIHDCEMLAIVESMKHWRHYLEGAQHPVRILSDHKNLEVFMSTKLLNRRQARWAELLSGYDFILVHIPGTKNPADGPSRRPDYLKGVEVPSGTLIPRSALRLLPEHSTPNPLNTLNAIAISQAWNLCSTDVFTPESPIRQRILDALADDNLAKQHQQPTAHWSWSDGFALPQESCVHP